ncbi:MAG: integrase family protein [Clostridia bacterium]|jgi:integrase|nr:integrase family protein [Clostridia bacterium]
MTNEKTSRGIAKAQEVQPLKNIKDIQKVKQYLLGKESKRDYMLFVVGINVGLRAGDLLNLKIGDVYSNEEVNSSVRIQEEKTKKYREFTLNKSAQEAIRLYLDSLSFSFNECDYLFKSAKGDNQPLTVESAHKIIKTLLRELNMKGNYGTHTLRKTFAYHTYINNIKENPSILDTLQKILNHSSTATTLRYIGITKEVITDVYNNLNL